MTMPSILLFVLALPAISCLHCMNGFEARIDGNKEFEVRSVIECGPDAKFCVTGWNNMVKNAFLTGFTEMRVWGCEGEKTQYTADVMPTCTEAGWLRVYDHVRHCCEGDSCNVREQDPSGLTEALNSLGLTTDFDKYVRMARS